MAVNTISITGSSIFLVKMVAGILISETQKQRQTIHSSLSSNFNLLSLPFNEPSDPILQPKVIGEMNE